LRKVALAITLTLLLSLANAPTHLSSTPPGSSLQDAGLGYAPEATDFVYPVGDPRIAPTFDDNSPNGYTITQMFNNSCDPAQGQGFYTAGQYFCGHTGVDLSDKTDGGVVRAVANGLVVAASTNSTYGEMVRIQHLLPDGTYVYSQYEHMEEGSLLVTVGQIVTMSQNIGLVGATGFVTGPHLHFEVKSINADGVGYTFGNPALIIGYVEPISYVAAHTAYLAPTATPTLPAPTDTPASVTDTATSAVGTDASANTGATPAVGTDASATPSVSVTAPLTSALGTAASSGGEQQGVLNSFYSRYHDYVRVTSDGMALNVRAGSGFDYPPLNSVRKGARLGYLGMTGNGWVRVALPGDVTGYVVRQWVQGDVLPKLPPSSYGDYKAPFVSVLDTRYPARTGPAMHDTPFEPLRLGEKLAFLGTNPTAPSWTRVVLPSGREAWVLNWYLSRPPAQPAKAGRIIPAVHRTRTPAPAFASSSVVTTADGVRLRQGPRLGAQLIETLQQGARLSLHGYHVSWANVTTSDGTEGYVLASFLGASPSATSAPKATQAPPAPAAPAAPAAHVPTRLPAAPAAHGLRPRVVSTATLLPARVSGSASGIAVQTHPSSATATSPRQTTTVPAVPAVPPAARVVVDVTAANLHAAPSRKATVVLSAQRHTALILRATSGDWLQVQTPTGATAWIMRDLTSSQ